MGQLIDCTAGIGPPARAVAPVETLDGVIREYVLAVDGGGSKTDLLLADPGGHALKRIVTTAFMPQYVGVGESVAQLDHLVGSALESVTDGRIVAAGIYFSGLDFPFEREAYFEQVSRCHWAPTKTLLVDNDVFAVLRTGTNSDTAVAVICGTGMNCVGRNAAGDYVRFPALGQLSGDWGGGGDIARSAIALAARADDGRGEPTILAKLIPAALGLGSMSEVILDFHTRDWDEPEIASLAPLVFQAADNADPGAIAIVNRQGDEIAAFAAAAIKRLGVLNQPVPVVLGGGIVSAGNPRLDARISEELANRAPGAYPVAVTAPPVLGSALLAFDVLGASEQAKARLREEAPRINERRS